jgi:hypothetical protein
MTRFAIYDTVKLQLDKPGQTTPFYQKVLLGGFAGCVGGLFGTPGDLINVRLVFHFTCSFSSYFYSAALKLDFLRRAAKIAFQPVIKYCVLVCIIAS